MLQYVCTETMLKKLTECGLCIYVCKFLCVNLLSQPLHIEYVVVGFNLSGQFYDTSVLYS